MLPNQPKKERVSNPTPYPSAHMMTAAIIFWRVDDGVGGRCRGCAGVTPTGGGPATCMSPQTGAGQRLGLRRRRVCLSLMAGMRRAPGIAEEGERARPSGTRPPRAIGAPRVVKVVGGDGLGDNQRPGRLAPRSFAVGDGRAARAITYRRWLGNLRRSVWQTAGQLRFRRLPILTFCVRACPALKK